MKRQASEYALLLCFVVFIVLFPLTKVSDFDPFFHLKLGEHVVEKGALYRLDEFSYSTAGLRQYTGEWLSNALFYLTYKYAGITGLGALKSVIFCAIVFFVYLSLRQALRQTDRTSLTRHASLIAIILFSYATRFRLDLRPYLFTYLSLSVFLYAFLRYRKTGGGLYYLPLVQALWSNTHGGFILGPLFAGLFVITESIRLKKLKLTLILPFIITFAASGLNPEGWEKYSTLLGFTPASGAPVLGEWQSTTPALLWGYGIRYTAGFQILAIGSAAYLLSEALKKRYDLFYIAVFVASVFYSLKHVRLMAESSVFLAPLFYSGLAAAIGGLQGKLSHKKEFIKSATNMVLAILLVWLTVFSIVKSDIYAFGFGFKEGVFPDGALSFLDRENIGGNGFNTVTAGSYMVWKSPHRKVFIDGRLVPSEEVDTGYEGAIKSMEGFDSLDKKYDFNYAIADYSPRSRWRFPLHLNFNPNWALVYWDETAVVYVRIVPKNSEVINKCGYTVLRPSFDDFSYLDHHMGKDEQKLLSSIDSDIALNPELQEPRLAKVFVLYYYGHRDRAFEALQSVLSMKPDTAFEHVTMAQLLLEMGNKKDAVKELKRALKIEPHNETAKKLLKTSVK